MTRQLKVAVQNWFRTQSRFTPKRTQVRLDRHEFEFRDGCGQECSIYTEGSPGSETLWVGRRFEPMLLTRELAADLLPILHYYVEYGEVPQMTERLNPVLDVLDVL